MNPIEINAARAGAGTEYGGYSLTAIPIAISASTEEEAAERLQAFGEAMNALLPDHEGIFALNGDQAALACEQAAQVYRGAPAHEGGG